jgi:hypothetical protein
VDPARISLDAWSSAAIIVGMRIRLRRVAFVFVFVGSAYVAVTGCGDDETATPPQPDAAPDVRSVADVAAEARSPEYTGSACTAPTECYATLEAGTLKGEAVCISKVTDGYCTHKCQTDQDCCAVPGECKTTLKQVCASFENTADKYCFLSCEDSDIKSGAEAGLSDAGAGDDYCRSNANTEFGCRSTGGGADNRKACIPVGPLTDGGGKDSGDAATDAPTDG